MSKVINLFGPSGVGKSTSAAFVFAFLKKAGKSSELVREYVKGWAWEDRQVRSIDQLYLLGKQARYESILYDKVDYIVTDCPVLLSGIYQKYFSELDYLVDTALNFYKQAEKSGVTYHNFLLTRTKPYDPKGRYGTEEESNLFGEFLKKTLIEYEVPFTEVDLANEERAEKILEIVGAELN